MPTLPRSTQANQQRGDKDVPQIERLVAEKRMVEVNIDVFSVDEMAHIFEVYWKGYTHYTFEFDSVSKQVALFLPETAEANPWRHIPLKLVKGFSQRMLDKHFVELVLECESGSCTLGQTDDRAAAQRWLAGANELLAFRKAHSQLF
jgi:hypothetical protein